MFPTMFKPKEIGNEDANSHHDIIFKLMSLVIHCVSNFVCYSEVINVTMLAHMLDAR